MKEEELVNKQELITKEQFVVFIGKIYCDIEEEIKKIEYKIKIRQYSHMSYVFEFEIDGLRKAREIMLNARIPYITKN